MSQEDTIPLISRVVFMQKRLEFVPKITQSFESQASGCFKNILKIPTTLFYVCFIISAEELLLETKIKVEGAMSTV